MAAALHNAAGLGFARHRAGDPPIVTGDIGLGEPLPPHEVARAGHAVLKRGEEAVLVRSIERLVDGTYTAEIYGFEPHHGVERDGIKLGDRIVFREEHVFTCGS